MLLHAATCRYMLLGIKVKRLKCFRGILWHLWLQCGMKPALRFCTLFFVNWIRWFFLITLFSQTFSLRTEEHINCVVVNSTSVWRFLLIKYEERIFSKCCLVVILSNQSPNKSQQLDFSHWKQNQSKTTNRKKKQTNKWSTQQTNTQQDNCLVVCLFV